MKNYTIPEQGLVLQILDAKGSTFTKHGKAVFIQTNIGPENLVVTKIHRGPWDVFDRPKYSWFIGDDSIADLDLISLLEKAYEDAIENILSRELSDSGVLRKFFNAKIGEVVLSKPFEELNEHDLNKLRENIHYPSFLRKNTLTT